MSDLTQFATARELDYLIALQVHGSIRKAAKALGVAKNSIDTAMKRLRARAALRSPQEHDYTKTVPQGFAIKGVSQYVGKDGAIAGTWVKTDRDASQHQAQPEEFAQAMRK